jgi:cytochrome c oxidase subunit II
MPLKGMRMKKIFGILVGLILIGSCGSTQEFTAIPPDVDQLSTSTETINITAEHFHFTPDEIHVKKGTLVTLHIRSIDGTHGFKLAAFGVDARVDEDSTASTQFFAAQEGEYRFRCSHICGIGHFGMTGKIVVE